ncbi:hypothetical protein FC83_GL001272 [Agrilactobacillus composti DSM 18527 = JCM 14202]|uniref:Competence protein ComGD n=2 Tax=Agrilactobacillus TaxID=2767875 RepID=A0A0R1XYC7_9LACO|nr:hypothetical protein FC83_GL001272 [Agrilactobacillus composti DSM 18527 = JCM 14202]
MISVLFVLSLLVSLSFLVWPSIQARQAEKQFFNEFESSYQRLLNEAMFRNERGLIKTMGERVVLTYPTVTNGTYINEIILPKGLSIPGASKKIYVSDEGIITPATIYFKSTNTDKTYIYHIQFGWGRLRVETL